MFLCVGIAVPRQAIRDKVKELYPESVNNRKRKTIVRREYTSNGPHDCWHVDGNHKLRKYRLCVHGAVDGFTRLVVMMRCSDNNRAVTVLMAFTEAVNTHGYPNFLYMDKGTENGLAADLHMSVRGPGTVLAGPSTRYTSNIISKLSSNSTFLNLHRILLF